MAVSQAAYDALVALRDGKRAEQETYESQVPGQEQAVQDMKDIAARAKSAADSLDALLPTLQVE